MGKFTMGKIFVTVIAVLTAVVLSACGPTLKAMTEPEVTLSSIELHTEGVKTSYLVGQFFDSANLRVEAVYTDRTRKEVTDYIISSKLLTVDESVVTVSYTEGNVTRTANLNLTVTIISGGEGFNNPAWWAVQPNGAVYNGDVLLGWKGNMPEGTVLNIKDGTRVIADNALYYYAALVGVTFPDSLVYIGAGAFSDTSVTKFEVPDSVVFIGENALASAAGNTISIGTGVIYDLEKTFNRTVTTMLEVAYHNENYTAMGGVLFNKDCTELITALTNISGSITLPDTVTEIAARAFYGCGGITQITLPNTLEKIGAGAFVDCTGIIAVSIPAGVTEIGRFAFSGCTKLKTVYLQNESNTATVIGRSVFERCSALALVEIYDKVIPQITADVFPNNTGLKIKIHTAGNLPSRLETVVNMGGWSVHAPKITEVQSK